MHIKQRKERWRAFYDLNSDVKTLCIVNLPYGERPWPFPQYQQQRVDWALRAYELQMKAVECVDDDQIPHLRPYTGTEIFANAFGSPIHYPEDNMPFALPAVHNAAEAEKLGIPDIRGGVLGMVWDIADALHERYPDAPMMLPDIQSPVDVAALVWEKADFLTSMHDEPEAVHALVAKAQTLMFNFLDAWFDKYGRKYIAHFPDYYMEGGVTLSEDEIGEVSPHMFDEFCKQPLYDLSERYGGIAIHCCAHAVHQWDNLAGVPGLRLINLIQPPEVTIKAMRRFERVCAQFHPWYGEGEPNPAWIERIPSDARIVLTANATDLDDAARKAEMLRGMAAMR